MLIKRTDMNKNIFKIIWCEFYKFENKCFQNSAGYVDNLSLCFEEIVTSLSSYSPLPLRCWTPQSLLGVSCKS